MSRPRAGGSGMPNHPDSSSRPPQGVDHRPTTGPFAPALSTLATPFGRPSRPSGLCVTISAFRSVSESPDQAQPPTMNPKNVAHPMRNRVPRPLRMRPNRPGIAFLILARRAAVIERPYLTESACRSGTRRTPAWQKLLPASLRQKLKGVDPAFALNPLNELGHELAPQAPSIYSSRRLPLQKLREVGEVEPVGGVNGQL